jgi:16S rRNA (guanine966-N2)-methyltransferase
VRIVAGTLRGRHLLGPNTDAIRPTSDRVRGAIFNILAHANAGVSIEGARVLDLFAGTGALGLEALSRGADFCLFVEKSSEARTLLVRNIALLGLGDQTEVKVADATRLGAAPEGKFGLVFLDPPYGQGLAEKALTAAASAGWLANNALIVVEERSDSVIDWPNGFEVMDTRRWGDTQALFARYRGT